MIEKPLILIFLLFCIIGCVYGGENIYEYDDASTVLVDNYQNITYAMEDGHLNTSFSNNYTGYCLEYEEQEAHIGDKYYVEDTSYAKNNNNGENISKYLKTYFVDYYNETQKDKIVTQHTIWHFSDDFNGWRINYTLIDDIKNNPKDYGDDGIQKWNCTHNLIYSFRVLISPYEHHQNYFIYKILFKEISPEENTNNTNQSPILNNTISSNNHTENLSSSNSTNKNNLFI